MRKLGLVVSALAVLVLLAGTGCSRPKDPQAYVPANAIVVGIFRPALFAETAASIPGLARPEGDFQPLEVLLAQKNFPKTEPIYFYLDTDMPNRHAFVVHCPQGDAGEFLDVLVQDAVDKGIGYREFDILGSRTLDWTGELTRYRATVVNPYNLLFTYNMSEDRIGVIMARRGENRLLERMLEEKDKAGLMLFCRSIRPLSMDVEIGVDGSILCTYAAEDPAELETQATDALVDAAEVAVNTDDSVAEELDEVREAVDKKKIETRKDLFDKRMERMIDAQPYPLKALLAAAYDKAEGIVDQQPAEGEEDGE